MARRIVLPSLIGRPRLPDWSARLADLVVQRLTARFAWGVTDCALWAADAIAAQLGVDPARDLRGQYATERQALRVMAPFGGLKGLAVAVLGPPLSAPLLAAPGDVGLMRCGALAVCGGETWLAVTSQGMGHMPLNEAQLTWRVGHA